MIKYRIDKEHNYKAIYCNGKTIRIALNPKIPITEIDYPEFYDVKITNKCNSGIVDTSIVNVVHGFNKDFYAHKKCYSNYDSCRYCYQNSNIDEPHFDNILEKTNNYFGSMSDNEKPFQVAIGGGEPTLHPDFVKLLKLFYDINITPNYTTNGVDIPEKILGATKKYCGGVAISCHRHLEKYWKKSIDLFLKNKILLNLHIIISDKESINYFYDIFNEYRDKIDYFVLLPYIAQGRATQKEIDYIYLTNILNKIEDVSKIAFGANFYKYLTDNKNKWDVSLYEPEIFSAYLDYKDMKLYKSSFNLIPKCS